MADSKKYYYMRLVENYFERTELKIIRQMPKGAEYLLILLKMSCKSFNRGGLLMITDNIPYTPESLAASIGEDLNDVRAALEILSEFSLIEMFKTNEINVKDIQNFIGHASSEADRKRRERNITKQLKPTLEDKTKTNDGQMSRQTSVEGQTSTIDRERGKSYSKEFIDKSYSKEKEIPEFTPPPPYIDPNLKGKYNIDEIINYWNGKENLPHCRRTSVQLKDPAAVFKSLSLFSQSEILKAIDNLDYCWNLTTEYKPAMFENFIIKSLDRWTDDAKPLDRLPKTKTPDFENDDRKF
jgi:predicted phage replisome organizer